jgi:biopolymer transport protein ExbD
MKIVKAVFKALTYRALIFSLALASGFAAFYLNNRINREPETCVLPTEIFNRKKADCPDNGRPNPLVITIDIDQKRQIKLNWDDLGNLENTELLEGKLLSEFRLREMDGVFRDNGFEIEKQVVIRLDKSTKYADVVKLIRSLEKVGANPIVLDTNREFCPGGGGSGGNASEFDN